MATSRHLKEAQTERWFARAMGLITFLCLAGVGWLLLGPRGILAGGILGLAAGLILSDVLMQRTLRRLQALARPFPESWRDYLAEHCAHYRRLPQPLRERFESDLKLFLAEKRISGIGVGLTDELRLLVAASAVTLSLGWSGYDWPRLGEVLLYPDDFDRDYGFDEAELAGQAGHWGTVILSVPSLLRSFRQPADGYHVGLHEFAHILDLEQTDFDGIPSGLQSSQIQSWEWHVEREMMRLQAGDSVIDPYGAEDPVEFLAVAVEAFFETPQALRRHHAEVYAVLAAYFQQDPAAWDDARGVELESGRPSL